MPTYIPDFEWYARNVLFHPRDKNGVLLVSDKAKPGLDPTSREYFDKYMREKGHFDNWELDKLWEKHQVDVGKIKEMIRGAVINPGDRMRGLNGHG